MCLDRPLIQYCAPTLAGLKIAGLFCVEDTPELEQVVAAYQARYQGRGLAFQILGSCKERRLVYVYRVRDVVLHLRKPEIGCFLRGYGYRPEAPLAETLQRLVARCADTESFPHELGVFLGYPLADVEAFIRHRGRGAKKTGEWKVYTDVCYAEAEFRKYALCRARYAELYDRGYSMMHLIIA